MTKRKLGEEAPTTDSPSVLSPSPLFSPGLTERQQIALAMKLSGESSQSDAFATPRPSKVFVLDIFVLFVLFVRCTVYFEQMVIILIFITSVFTLELLVY